MEFHKKINNIKKPEIITKKKITPKIRIFSSHSQSNIPAIKQFNTGNQSLTEKKNILNKNSTDIKKENENNSIIENVKMKINEKIDTNSLIGNVPSSLVINLRPKYEIKRPINKYAQIKNPNPLKQFEYQQQLQSLHSSQKSIPNSIVINANASSNNNSGEKNSNSSVGIPPLYVHRSASNLNKANNNYNNEMEIEINGDEETSPKVRYHRPRKKISPLFTYNNTENEEIIYNMPLTDEDSIGKNNFGRYHNQYFDAYEINEGMDPVQIRVLNKKFKKDNLLYGNPFIYSSDEALENTSSKFEENRRNLDSKKKFVRQYTDIYDPKKNKKGILLQKTKMTMPLIEAPLLDEKVKFFSRNSKLSDLIMTKKKYSPDPINLFYEDFYSGSEDKTTCHNEPKIRNLKTFNRRSFEKFTQNLKSLKLHKSPEERFKKFSLAMISSKGKNTENRPISRKMRFEKGGVVDLTPNDGRRKRFKYLIKKMSRSPGRQLIHNNPKYREKAAELIQEWWFSIKEFRKKRIESAILIQSCFRGSFTRKYLYDVIYMNYLYFGFCKKIEKFIRKKYGPYFINCLFDKYIKKKKLLKQLVKIYENEICRFYLNKWKKNTKKDNKKKLALLYLLRIRAIRESKMFNLKRVFNKWNYITIIKKERSSILKDLQNKEDDLKEEKDNINRKIDIDKIKKDNMEKIKGLIKIINGTDKFIKKKVVEFTNPKIKEYMKEIIIKNCLKNLLKIKEKKDKNFMKKYLYIYYNKCFYKEIKDNKIKKAKILNEYNNYSDFDYLSLNDKLEKMKKEINLLQKMKIKLFILKIEPYLSSKKDLFKLFLNSILFKVEKLQNILDKNEKLQLKDKKNIDKKISDKVHEIEEKNKKNKKIKNKEESNSSVSEEEKEKQINKRDKIYSKEKKEDKKPIKKYDKKAIKNEEDEEEEEEYEESEDEIDINRKKKEKDIKKPYKYKTIGKGKEDMNINKADGTKKEKKYITKDNRSEDSDESKSGKEKKIISKKVKEKNQPITKEKKIIKKRYSSSSEEEEENEEMEEEKPKTGRIKKLKEKENIKDEVKQEKTDKKIYTRKKVKSDKRKDKENEQEVTSEDEEVESIKKKDKNKKRKYRRKSNQKEQEKEFEEEEEEYEEEDEEQDEEIDSQRKRREKKRSSSLDEISEKSKELSDNNKEYSTISDDSKNKDKIRANSEKAKTVKKTIKYDKDKGQEKNIKKKKISEDDIAKDKNKGITKKEKIKKAIKKGSEIDSEDNEENEEISEKEKNKKKLKPIGKQKIIDDEDDTENEEIDNIKKNQITKYKKKTKEGDITKKQKEENDKNNSQIKNIQKKYILKNILKIKKSKDDKILQRYFNIWRLNKNISKAIIQNKDSLLKKNAIKILYIFANNLNKKLLNRKFNQLRRISSQISNLEKKTKESNNYVDKVIKIQNAFRQMIAKNKLEKIKQLNNELINIVKNREKSENTVLIFNLRKWNMISKKLSCINKINLIQKNFRKYLSKRYNNKYKSFFNNIHKYKLISSINEIAKYYSLKSSITNISKKRVISQISQKIKNNKIMKILSEIINIIDGKNSNAKMKYYLNKWNNRIKYIKNKDNKKLKVLLLRIFDKKDNLKYLLKSYFLRWKRIHNLLSIVDSIIKIQNSWRKKKSIDDYNKRKDYKNNIINIFKTLEKIYKKNNYDFLIDKLQNKSKKYLLNKIENNFTKNKNNNLKYAVDKIRLYIKNKYLYKATNISENSKNRIIKKYFSLWKNKTNNDNKIYKYLNKFIEKKEIKINNIILSSLLKWLYHSKMHKANEKVTFIQKIFRNLKKRKDSVKNWEILKNRLCDSKRKSETKNIIRKIALYKSLDILNNNIKNKVRKNILKDINHYNKVSLSAKIIKKILLKINGNKTSKSLKKYFLLWKDNINKEIEREEKLNDLLYVIEKRMNINSANYLSYVSLLKNIFDGVINKRKLENFKKLRKFAERDKNMNNLSKSLSSAYNDLKSKKQKILVNKILKYFIYQKFLKLFEKIEQKKSTELKIYKALLITYLKKKVESDISSLSDNSKKKRNSNPSKITFKPRPKNGIKNLNKSKNQSQGIIRVNTVKNEPKKNNTKDKIRKNIVVKGAMIKSKSRTNIVAKYNKNKERESLTHKSEEESENDNEIEYIKENIKTLYINIEKLFTRRKKETLVIIKEKVFKEKTEREKEEKKIFYTKKLGKTLKKLTIKKMFVKKEEISRAKRLIQLIKLTTINSQISTDRWIRQLIRRWRFISFVKNVSKKKLELMYKNLHVGYLEIINSLFNNESKFPSMIKEFENFGTDVGMYKNSDYYMNREKELYQRVKKKYIAKPIEYDRENSLKIESGKFINELRYKSDEGEDMDIFITDSDKDILKKHKARISNNYDHDK